MIEQHTQHLFYDEEYLRYLLREERDGTMISYIEQNFPEESWLHQQGVMMQFPYFGNKILRIIE